MLGFNSIPPFSTQRYTFMKLDRQGNAKRCGFSDMPPSRNQPDGPPRKSLPLNRADHGRSLRRGYLHNPLNRTITEDEPPQDPWSG